MYKSRIRQWGLAKYNREDEKRVALQKYKRRADYGKVSSIRIRGRTVQYADIVSYFKRKHIEIEDVIAQRRSSATPETVECMTPLPSRISTPAVHSVPEKALLAIRDYCYGSFETGTWIKTKPLDSCYSTREGWSDIDLTYELYMRVGVACDLFDKGHSTEAGQLLIAATASITAIIQSEAPRMLTYIFAIILKVCCRGRPEIVRAILKTFSDFCEVLLCESHPLRRLYSILAFIDTSQLEEVAIVGEESRIDHFKANLGPMHISTLDAHQSYFETIAERRSGGQEEVYMKKLLATCSAELGDFDYRVLYCRMYFACYLIKKGRNLEALRECQDIFKLILTPESPPKMVNIETVGLHLLCSELGLHQNEQGEVSQRDAIRLFMINRGQWGARTRFWLIKLERFLRRWGQQDPADEVCGWMQTIVELKGKLSNPNMS